MWRQLLSIARITFIESIRQPIFIVLLLIGIGWIVVLPSTTAYSMEHGGDDKLLIDFGLASIAFFGSLLTAFTATGVLTDEIENKTVLTVVTKPVPRSLFIIGKFLGVALAIALASYIMSVALMLTVRHGVMQTVRHEFDQPVLTFGLGGAFLAILVSAWANYFYRKVFNSTLVIALTIAGTMALGLVLVIGKGWTLQSPLTAFAGETSGFGQLALGLVMVIEAMIIMTAVAIACAARLKKVVSILTALGVYVLGGITGSLDYQVNQALSLPHNLDTVQSFAPLMAHDANWGLKLVLALVKVVHLLAPNLQFLWPGEILTQGLTIHLAHLGPLTGYALLYTIAVLGLAVILFQRREVG